MVLTVGFERERRQYRLIFEGDLAGLEVSARSVGLGEYLAISDLANVTMPLKAGDVARFKRLLKAFSEALVEWNLEERGQPVSADHDGLLSQEPDLVLRIVLAWMDAVAGVSVPLGQPSNDGEPFPEASLPMEALSLSQ